jgi:RNA polymerase sigma-70 factor (ECF subfamily)
MPYSPERVTHTPPAPLSREETPRPARLAAAFLAASEGLAARADLGERLLAMVLAAQAAHPRVRLDDERFVHHLARHRPPDATLDGWLGSICAGDLYLACACAEGAPAAIEALDLLFRSQVGGYLAGLRPAPDFVDDVAQAVRERLLVGAGGSPPRIAEYSGRGPLSSWLRVVTVRLALAMRRKRTELVAAEEPEEEAAPVDAEIDALKRRHAGEVNAAFRAAVGALTSQQRDLLRRHFVEGATLAELAAALGVGRATVARWVAAARQEILARAHRQLREKLRLRPAELESLMRLMRSQLDLSLSTAFPEAP